MSVNATAKGVRMSPRKVREVAALVRGRTVADAPRERRTESKVPRIFRLLLNHDGK